MNCAGPLQRLGRESRCAVKIVDTTKLVSRVVVAMNGERDARFALSQKPSRGPVDVPLVQGNRRSRHAVIVGFGMSGELRGSRDSRRTTNAGSGRRRRSTPVDSGCSHEAAPESSRRKCARGNSPMKRPTVSCSRSVAPDPSSSGHEAATNWPFARAIQTGPARGRLRGPGPVLVGSGKCLSC